jgi:hypothetical protein
LACQGLSAQAHPFGSVRPPRSIIGKRKASPPKTKPLTHRFVFGGEAVGPHKPVGVARERAAASFAYGYGTIMTSFY